MVFVNAQAGGPSNGNRPPIIAPSAPNLILFFILANASSLPLKLVVSIGLPGNKVASSGNILVKEL